LVGGAAPLGQGTRNLRGANFVMDQPGMRISTLLRYWVGDRQAIVELSNCRSAVTLGFVFVLSAGFAREYDGEDLLHEPWHVLLPLGASLLTSFLLFVLFEAVFPNHEAPRDDSATFRSRYLAFLGLYWLTAPLAWLYAIPVERFLDAPGAVRVNLGLLGVVSLWRVVLMTRVAAVLYARTGVAAFLVVMLFADTVAMIVFWLTPLPILSIMGGIRLSESEQIIQNTGFFVRLVGTVTWPLWLIGTLVVAWRRRRRVREPRPVALASNRQPTPVSRGLWTAGALSILVWAAFLPFTQPEQLRRRRTERDLRNGRIAEALRFMSQYEQSDFPPHWDPPPRVGYGERRPPLVEVLLQFDQPGTAPWVQTLFLEKLAIQADAHPWDYSSHAIRLYDLNDAQLARYAALLQTMPEGRTVAQYHATEINALLDPQYYGESSVKPSDERRASLEAIQRLLPPEESHSE
jgi:hypothetical protein